MRPLLNASMLREASGSICLRLIKIEEGTRVVLLEDSYTSCVAIRKDQGG